MPGRDTERLEAYRALYTAHIDDEPITDIREALRRGLALSNVGVHCWKPPGAIQWSNASVF